MIKRIPFPFVLLLLAAWQVALGTPDLFRKPQYEAAYISPDGKNLALLINEQNDQHIDIRDIATGDTTRLYTVADALENETLIGNLAWTDNRILMFNLYELKEGIAKLSDTKKSAQLFFLDTENPEEPPRYVETGGRVHNMLSVEPNNLLFGVPGRTSHLYRIDVSKLYKSGQKLSKTALPDGGVFSKENRIATVDGFAMRWITRPTGEVHSVITIQLLEKRIAFLSWSDEEEWTEEFIWSLDEKDEDEEEDQALYVPLAIGEQPDEYITLIDQNDEEALYIYNFKTKAKRLLFDPPGDEILSVNFGFDGSTLLEVSYFHNGQINYHYLDNSHIQTVEKLGAAYPGYSANIASIDAGEKLFVVNLTSPTQPGKLVLVDTDKEQPTELLDQMPWLDNSTLADSIIGRVTSGDLEIEYFLTLPDGAGPFPLVVYPHGGPWNTRDVRAFNPLMQLIASQGFAVLQVNFRGSEGYGREFAEEIKGEFGDAVLADIEAALDAVSSRPDIAGSKVCVAGYSYGGYAALQMVARRPERYKCAASSSSPLDLPLLVNSWEESESDKELEMILGSTVVDEDALEKLRQISPVYNYQKIKIPVLLTHGDKDEVVDREHSYRMKQLLEKSGNAPVWHLYADQKHAIDSLQDYAEHGNDLVEFLASHLADE